jgi:SAM-dependent methyltransferase
MDLLVLGTSNCVISDSFVDSIRPRTGITLRNLSLGACTSSLGLYMLSEVPPVSRGVALIDYGLIDGWALSVWGALFGAQLERNLKTLMMRLRSLGYTPLVLLAASDIDADYKPVQDRVYEAVCAAAGVSIINLRIILRRALFEGATVSALMRDGSHLSAAAGAVLGELLSALIDRMAASRPAMAEIVSEVIATRVVPSAELFSADRLVTHESSLRRATCGRLRTGDVLRVPARQNERIGAILLNTGAKGGIVAIRGAAGEVIKSLTSYWHEADPEAFSSYIVDILAPVTGGDAGIAIEIVDKDWTPTETTLMNRRILPGRYGEIEIEGILLCGTEASTEKAVVPVYDWLPLDIAAMPEASLMVTALARLRPPGGADQKGTIEMAKAGTREVKAWLAGKEFTSPPSADRFGSWSDQLDPIREQPVAILDVGAGEGASSIFLLRYLPQGRLTAVDSFWDASMEKRFQANTSEFGNRLELIRKLSLDALHALVWAGRQFDVIHLDGSHERDLVVVDSILAWKLLKVGGLLIWNGYFYGDDLPDEWRPRSGIDLFLRMQLGSYQLLLKRDQVVIRRTKGRAPIAAVSPADAGRPDMAVPASPARS